MTAKAEVEFSGEGAQMLRTLKAIETGFGAITKQVEKQAEATKQAAEESESMFEKMNLDAKSASKELSSVVLQWASVAGAIAIATKEHEKHNAVANKSADFNTRLGTAKANYLLNAGAGMTSDRANALLQQAQTASGGRSAVAIAESAGPIASAASTLTPEQQMQFIGAAGRLTPGNDDGMVGLSKTGVLLAETVGIKDPRAALGYALAAQQGSLQADVNAYGASFTPVQASAKALGFAPNEATAIFNALGKSTGDKGESSSTNTITFQTQLAQVRDKLKLPATAGVSEILSALRSPANASQLKDLSAWSGSDAVKGEARFGASIRQLLTGQGAAADIFASELKRLPQPGAAAGFYNDKLKLLESDASVRTLIAQQTGMSSAEALLKDPKSRERGTVNKLYEELRSNDPNRRWLGDRFDDYDFAMADIFTDQSPGEIGAAQLRKEADRLSRPKKVHPSGWHRFFGVGGEMQGPNEREQSYIDELRRMATAMEDTARSNREMADRDAQRSTQPQVSTNGDRPAFPTGGKLKPNDGPDNARPVSYSN